MGKVDIAKMGSEYENPRGFLSLMASWLGIIYLFLLFVATKVPSVLV